MRGVVNLIEIVEFEADDKALVKAVKDALNRDPVADAYELRVDASKGVSFFETCPDDEIAQAVRDAFVYDPRVLSFDPRVHVSNGVVTLSGVVDNLAAKQAAEQDARNVVGVAGVRNHLKVRPDEIPPNDVLEARVGRALIDDEHVERWEVDVEAYSGSPIGRSAPR